MSEFEVTERNRLMRYPKRASYDRAVIYPIIDEALVCHVSFALDGQPFVIPTIHARDGDSILLHGLKGGRLLEYIEAGNPVAIAMTIVDGIVFARTVFNHSMNYRSVVLFGRGKIVEEPEAKLAALHRLTERVIPGRWEEARAPNEKEIKATTIVAIDIEQATSKCRQGPPGDDGEDLEFPVWAGVLPTPIVTQAAQTDPKQTAGFAVPDYVKNFDPAKR